MAQKPLEVHAYQPLPPVPNWDEVSELHVYGHLDLDHKRFVLAALNDHRKGYHAMDQDARDSLETSE